MITILDCIEEIPKRLDGILKSQNNIFKQLTNSIGNNKYSKIAIIASGSSYNAAFATHSFGNTLLNKDIQLYYPNMFVNFLSDEAINNETLYIFISQTGTTKLVLDAVKKVNSLGGDTISITEKIDSPVAKEASIVLEMGSKDEAYIYRTIGYSTSILTLIQIYLYLANNEELITQKEIEKYNEDVEVIIESLPFIQKETLEWYEENKNFITSKKHYIFSGTNDLWAVAQEADIKFMEMLPVLSNSFELEEIIHGPQNMFRDDQLIFLLIKDDIGKEKANSISNFIENEVGKSSLIVSNNEENNTHLKISSKSKYFYTLEYVTVFQILAYLLGINKNRDFTKGIYPNVTDYIKKSVN